MGSEKNIDFWISNEIKQKNIDISWIKKLEKTTENLELIRFQEKVVDSYIEKANDNIENKLFHLDSKIENWNIYLYQWDIKLNIPFSQKSEEELKSLLEVLTKWLNTNEKIKLDWDFYNRDILVPRMIVLWKKLHWIDGNAVSTKNYAEDFKLEKTKVEEVFIFLMDIKRVPEKDWLVWDKIYVWKDKNYRVNLWIK